MRFDDLDWDDCVFNPAKVVNMCRIAVCCFLCGKILIIQFKTESQNLVLTHKFTYLYFYCIINLFFLYIKYIKNAKGGGPFAFLYGLRFLHSKPGYIYASTREFLLPNGNVKGALNNYVHILTIDVQATVYRNLYERVTITCVTQKDQIPVSRDRCLGGGYSGPIWM